MKKIRLILFALLGVVLFPMYASATVLYDKSAIGTAIDNNSNNASAGAVFVPNGNSANYSTYYTTDHNFFTVGAVSIEKLRVKRISGAMCGDYALGNVQVLKYPFGAVGMQACTDNGNFLDFTLQTPITTGQKVNAVTVYTPNTSFLDGSSANGGYSYGTSWGAYTMNGGFAFQLCDSGGCSGGFTPPSITTRFIDLSEPINGTTTPSGSVDFTVQYYFNNSTHSFTEIGLHVLRGDQYFTSTTSFGTIIDGQNTFNRTLTLGENGSYVWRAEMQGGTSTPMYSDWHTFTTVSNPYPSLIGTTSPEGSWSLATSTCSFTNISGCFQNALMFVFQPSSDVLDLYAGLKDQIAKKPPFGYFALLQGELGSISSTSTPTFSVTIPQAIQTRMFDPIKNGLVILIWLMWGVHLFHKLRNIKI